MIASQILRLLLVLVVGWAVVSALAFLYGERVLFQPPPASYDRGVLEYALIPVGDDDSVAVQHIPNPAGRYTVLFSHGNAEDLGHLQPLLRMIHRAGFGVLAYDYRGYGRSTALVPTEKRAIEDVEAVYRYARDTLEIAPERLIAHGRSLGGGPTLELAQRHPIGAVVLESTFTSTYRVVTRLPLIPFDRFPNLARVRTLNAPVLVMHGERDRVIGVGHGRTLFRAAREPKHALWVEGAGHNDLAVVAGERYAEALRSFAEALSRAEP